MKNERQMSGATAAGDATLADIPRLLAALPSRIDDIVTLQAARRPAGEALREKERAWTYAELAASTAGTAQHLAAAGVRAGDRVMVVGENCAALVALLFGIARLDAWPVLINARLSAREIDAIRDHCQPRRIAYLAQVSAEAAGHAARHGAVEHCSVAGIGEVLMGPMDEECQPEPPAAGPAEQVGALIYTTGTTGDPKGVMLTHRNLLFIAKLSSTLRKLSSRDRVYGALPISHVYGLASVCMGTLFAGACLHLVPRFSPEAFAHALAHSGITVAQGVPAMYARLLEYVRSSGQRFAAPRLRFLYAGGSPLDAALKADVEQLLGLTLHNGYGLTETSPTVTQTRLESPRSDCSVGTAIPGVEVRAVDATGRDVPAGEAGELWVRGPNVMRGYYKNADLTARTINADGWLNTGDVARIEDDGALTIVGRTRELIIRSGFNVFPAEVEAVLNSHPAVLHSAVVGRTRADNEEVVAFVELAPGRTACVAELLRFAAERLAPYKRPAEIVILPALPASATGKVLKQQLRAMADVRPSATVAR
jgi:acyl-CoA synthetase (AMP-forming)/AMP-acid ligase II